MKAFLSHSSLDAQLVRSVATELTRQFCVFSENEFETGDDFLNAIQAGLDESTVFVLFASHKSLGSVWVSLELREAELRRIGGQLKRALVYLIDPDLGWVDLPDWLQKGLARRMSAPRQIARDIVHHLNGLLIEERQPIFVNRREELNRGEQILIPSDGSAPPRVLVVSGLAGIGRRTLLRRIASDILSLNKTVEIGTEDGDDAADVCLKLAEQVEPYATKEEFNSRAQTILHATPAEIEARIALNLTSAVKAGELPLFVDGGGMLDGSAFYTPAAKLLLSLADKNEDVYLGLVTQRRPAERDVPSTGLLDVRPLSLDDTKRLVSSGAVRKGVKLSAGQVAELAEYIKGYPPAVYYSLEMIRHYGAELVLANKHPIVAFISAQFVRLVAEDENLTDTRRKILLILAYYSPLPKGVIGRICKVDSDKLQQDMMYLIDASLVYPDSEGGYRLADPLIDAVRKEIGGPTLTLDHGEISIALKNELEALGGDDKRLQLSRQYFRAGVLSGQGSEDTFSLKLASDLIALTLRLYHDRDYERAADIGHQAVEQRPMNVSARSISLGPSFVWNASKRLNRKLPPSESSASRRKLRFCEASWNLAAATLPPPSMPFHMRLIWEEMMLPCIAS